ncbi:putative acyltransferase [Monocercomonoides exilis]|uniref:putative acyltransferase n=1 Tax=Monocercomonoides exilis TaxID=2049356 RepID=UPI00355A38E2|nr:putative acyltransferase [Monocercomonoides exilis]|eukprot:MONOS_12413.1-p1 / transcript=MONOS_12413.1 / gene=MONOS_12413 / organism=Monocercomonoides_exilis_PA203 / gene_product=acyltransferase / transcript_product=acyltransferase / location=Mono_scaffold00686:23948-25141(-) / protein_length=397 / sequence_SO=supercontig / SO=protein_coding / is_pseudo=false
MEKKVSGKPKSIEQRKQLYSLDGIRGICGICVVFYHLVGTIYHYQPYTKIVNHGYLIVDFFYLITGFVLGYAYDKKKTSLSAWSFVKRRFVRLQPLVFLTSLVPTFFLRYLNAPSIGWVNYGDVPVLNRVVLLILATLNIPAPKSLVYSAKPSMFPLNPPQWFLVYAYIGNILYIAVLRHCRTSVLCVCAAISALCTGYMTFTSEFGYVNGGFLLNDRKMAPFGIVRLMTPLLIGQVISRVYQKQEMKSKEEEKKGKKSSGGIRFAFWIASACLISMSKVPYLRKEGESAYRNAAFDTSAVTIIEPLILMVIINGCQPSQWECDLFVWMGKMSYSLFLCHCIFIDFVSCWVANNNLSFDYVWIMFVGIIVLSVVLAHFYEIYFNEPVQKWISVHLRV